MKDYAVRDIMTTKVIFVTAPGKKSDAIRLFIKHRISGLPVVKRGTQNLVGIVTRQNIFDHPHEEQIAMIMTKDPVVMSPEAPAEAAARLLGERRIRRLPVVKGDKLVGMLTCMDLLKVIERMGMETTIEGFLKSPCVPVHEGTPLPVVDTIFHLSNSYAMPVLDDRSRIVGIVTDHDLFGLTTSGTRTVTSTMGLGEDEDSWNYEGVRNLMKLYYETSERELPAVPVKKVMVKDPETATLKTSVSEAARKMRARNFRQLPVRDSSDRLVAMLSDVDLVSVLVRDK